jgi:hypothetical protein
MYLTSPRLATKAVRQPGSRVSTLDRGVRLLREPPMGVFLQADTWRSACGVDRRDPWPVPAGGRRSPIVVHLAHSAYALANRWLTTDGADGGLPAIRIGRSIRILAAALDRLAEPSRPPVAAPLLELRRAR